MDDYLAINRHSWNNRTEAHLASEFYNHANFMQGNSSLNPPELALLGDVKGKTILHLQCHFGQDTISLSRLGAQVTGVDLSDNAIQAARNIAAETGSDTSFICCDLYDLPNHLEATFDLVFTSYGTIAWLPDLDRWAGIIARYLKPGGKLVMVEFHPVVWMFDDQFEKIEYRYFNSGPIAETEQGTYADRNAPISQQFINWNHGLGEVISSLIRHGLTLDLLNEYDYSPYNCFSPAVEVEPGKFRIAHCGDKIPMLYALKATRNHPG